MEMSALKKLETMTPPRMSVTDVVTRYVRALQNSAGSTIETLYRIADERAEALEFIVGVDFRGLNVPLKDLKTSSNTLIAGIVRGRKTLIPNGLDSVQAGDRVIVVTAGRQIRELSDILR